MLWYRRTGHDPIPAHTRWVRTHAAARHGPRAFAGKKSDKKGLGLNNSKATSFSDWYTELVVASELISYYDVSGCYILRPWAYAMWEVVQGW